MVNAFWLIPAPPLFGALAMLLLGRKLGRDVVSVLCCTTVLASFVMAAAVFVEFLTGNSAGMDAVLGDWLPSLGAEWGFHWDALSAVVTLVITGIGSLIHIYSVGYMKGEGGYYRFFGALNFFVFAMLLLVLSNNY